MTQPERGGAAKLYTPRLLALSAGLANYPLSVDLPHTSEMRARTCGSTITMALDTDDAGAVTQVGMQVSACAVGQSSAAILAQSISGKSHADLDDVCTAIERWLAEDTPPPHWHGFDALIPARAHAGRHEALLLPWRAALKALSMVPSNG